MARPVQGHVLQTVTQAEQEEQQAALGPIAKRGCAERGDDHQEVDVEAQPKRSTQAVLRGLDSLRRCSSARRWGR